MVRLLKFKLVCILYSYIFSQPLPPEMTPGGVKFSYEDYEAKKVTVAGTFNDWSKDRNFLKKDEYGIWSTVIPLKEGRYEYKFVVDEMWMPGPNLVVEVVRDKKTGQLYIPLRKGRVTPYSERIRFGGRYTGLYPVYFSPKALKEFELPTNFFSLDWYFNVTNEIFGCTRFNLHTRRFKEYNLIFSRGHLNLLTKYFGIRLYYNEPVIFIGDPMETLTREVPLRYEINSPLPFVYRYNPFSLFGTNSFGVKIDLKMFEKIPIFFFYGNMANTNEDYIGVRIKKEYHPFKIGLGIANNRGIKYPYAKPDNWFPDPEETPAWYKGFLYNDRIFFDIDFNIIKTANIFAEYRISNFYLRSTRWNEGVPGRNIPFEKTWMINKSDELKYGLNQIIFEKVKFELGQHYKQSNLGKLLSQITAREVSIYSIFSYTTTRSTFGIRVSQIIRSKLEKNIPKKFKVFHPYNYQYYLNWHEFDVEYSSRPIIISDGILSFRPFLNMSFRELNIWSLSDIKIAKYYGVDKNLVTILSYFYLSHIIRGPWSAEILFRYFYINDQMTDINRSFVTPYFGLIYKFGRGFWLKFGFGVDPYGFEEDIYRAEDMIDEALKSVYLENITKSSVIDSIISAEEYILRDRGVFIRAEIRF